MIKNKQNLLNFIFLSFISGYLILLFSRLFQNKLPKLVLSFILIYFIIGMGFLAIKLIFNWIKRFKKKENIYFERFKEKFLFIKESFNEFFFVFLGENKKVRKFFFFLIKVAEKIIDKSIFIIIFNIILSILFLFLIFDSLLSEKLLWTGLYILTFQGILRMILLIFCEITIKFLGSLAKVNLLIYLPKIIKTDKSFLFFINNSKMKDLLLNLNFISNTERIFFWEVFSHFHHFYSLNLKLCNLKTKILNTNKLLRNLNLVIFANILLFFFVSKIIFFLCFFVSLFIIFLLFGHFLDFFETDLRFKYNKIYPVVANEWFCKKREILLEDFNLNVVFPYQNNKSYEKMVSEHFELLKIIEENQTLPDNATRFDEFSRFSDYKLSKESFSLIVEGENYIIEFFTILDEKDLIDVTTYKIKE